MRFLFIALSVIFLSGTFITAEANTAKKQDETTELPSNCLYCRTMPCIVKCMSERN